MTRNFILAAAAVAGLLVFSSAGYAFPGAPMKASASATVQQPNVQKVTFWGRAFPYRYTWSVTRACTRYVPVETAHGTVTRRVWVCGGSGRYKTGAVVSYRN
jgi:hypothetical protein